MAIPTWIKPMLHVAHHPTADCLLVTDCGLVDGGTVGVWRVQRGSGADGVWSDRYAIAPADIEPALDPGSVTERGQTHSCWMVNEAGARLLVGTTAKEEFSGGTKFDYFNYHRVFDVQTLGGDADAGTQMMAETGPEGGWFRSPPAPNWTGFTTGPTVHAHGYTENQCVHNIAQASGVAAQGRYFVASIAPLIWNEFPGGWWEPDISFNQAGGYPQFGVYERDGSYTRVNAMYTVYTNYSGTAGWHYPSLAMHPYTYRLYLASCTYDTLGHGLCTLLTSDDQGLTWKRGPTIGYGGYIGQNNATFPALYCDHDYLWLAVFKKRPVWADPMPADVGADGEVVVYQYRHDPLPDLDEIGCVQFELLNGTTQASNNPSGSITHSVSGLSIAIADQEVITVGDGVITNEAGQSLSLSSGSGVRVSPGGIHQVFEGPTIPFESNDGLGVGEGDTITVEWVHTTTDITVGKVVGASDEGRPAIIRDPKTWQLTLVAPKMQSWTGAATAPAIAEYTSADSGSTWTRKDIHSA